MTNAEIDAKIAELSKLLNKNTPQQQAFYDGAAAADKQVPAWDNPHKDGALFDPLQLAQYWYEGHGHATRRDRGKIGRARRKSAAHYAF